MCCKKITCYFEKPPREEKVEENFFYENFLFWNFFPFCAFQLINRFILSRHQLFCLSHKLIICAYNVTENEEKFAHAPTKNFSAYFFLSVHFIAIVAAVLTIYFLKISRRDARYRECEREKEEEKRTMSHGPLSECLIFSTYLLN